MRPGDKAEQPVFTCGIQLKSMFMRLNHIEPAQNTKMKRSQFMRDNTIIIIIY